MQDGLSDQFEGTFAIVFTPLIGRFSRIAIRRMIELGAGYPYDIFDRDEYSKEWTQLIHDVDRKLWREGAGGVGRYESDYYRDGNPWILATVWLGLAAAQHGETDIARKCWDWTVEHATEHGLYSEQIDPKTGNPSWVMPLTWSHAMFALAVHQFDKEVMK